MKRELFIASALVAATLVVWLEPRAVDLSGRRSEPPRAAPSPIETLYGGATTNTLTFGGGSGSVATMTTRAVATMTPIGVTTCTHGPGAATDYCQRRNADGSVDVILRAGDRTQTLRDVR